MKKERNKMATSREQQAIERVQASQRFVMSQTTPRGNTVGASTLTPTPKSTPMRGAVSPPHRTTLPQILGSNSRPTQRQSGLHMTQSPVVITPQPTGRELGLHPRPFPAKKREEKKSKGDTKTTTSSGVNIPSLDFTKLKSPSVPASETSKHYRQLISLELADEQTVLDSGARFNYSPRPIPVKPLVHLNPSRSLLANTSVLNSPSGIARTGRLPRRGMEYGSPILFREVVTDRGDHRRPQHSDVIVAEIEPEQKPAVSEFDALLADVPTSVAPHHLPLDLFEPQNDDIAHDSKVVVPAVAKYLHADGTFEWRACQVYGYDKVKERYRIIWDHSKGTDIKYAGRLNVRLLSESQAHFDSRLKVSECMRDETERLVRLVYFWDSQADDPALAMPNTLLSRMIARVRGSMGSLKVPLQRRLYGDDTGITDGVEEHYMRVQKLIKLAEEAEAQGNNDVLKRLIDAGLLPSGPPTIPGQPQRGSFGIDPEQHSETFTTNLYSFANRALIANPIILRFLNAIHHIANDRHDLCLFLSVPDVEAIDMTRWVGEVENRLVAGGRDIRVAWPSELIDCMRSMLQRRSGDDYMPLDDDADDEFTFIMPRVGASYNTLSHHREPDPDARWAIPMTTVQRLIQLIALQQEYALGIILEKAMNDIIGMLGRFVDSTPVFATHEPFLKRHNNVMRWPPVKIDDIDYTDCTYDDLKPIFNVQVILLSNAGDEEDSPYAELCFEPPLEHFHEQLMQAFDDAVSMCNGVCRIDGIMLVNPELEQMELNCPVSNERIAERREMLDATVIRSFAGPQLFQQRLLDTYGGLIDQHEGRDDYVSKFISGNPSLGDYRHEIQQHQTRGARIMENLPSNIDMGAFSVDLRPVRSTLATMSRQLADELLQKLHESALEEHDVIEEIFTSIMNKLRNTPQSPEEWAEISGYVERIEEVSADIRSKIDGMMAKYGLLSDFLFDISSKESEDKYSTLSWPPSIIARSKKTESVLEQARADFEAILARQKADLQEGLNKAVKNAHAFEEYSDMDHADEYLTATSDVKNELEESQSFAAKCNARETIFNLEVTEFGELDAVVARLGPHARLWRIVADWGSWYNEWYFGVFSVLNASAMSDSVESCAKELAVLEEQLKGFAGPAGAAHEVLTQVKEFQAYMPLVLALRNGSMRLRHWKHVGQLIGMPIEESDIEFTVTLSTLVETHNVMDHLDEINKISQLASEELVIEQQLDKMQSEWQAMHLTTELYLETKAYILQRPDAAMRLIEDQLIAIQGLMQSKHVTPHLDRISLWERKLARTQDVFDEWLRCQRGWMHFQPIFSANDLINVRPNEARKFAGVDRKWREIMLVAVRTPKVLVATSTPKLLETLRDCNKALDEVRGGLASWLDQKRMVMPRLFFLSNDELYSILFVTSDNAGISTFLPKLFPGVARLTIDAGKIVKLEGKVGESLLLTQPVSLGRSAEFWLTDLESSMRKSVSAAIQAALAQWHEPGTREHGYGRLGAGGGEWKAMKQRLLLSWPNQAAVVAHKIGMASDVTEALSEKDKDKRAEKLSSILRRVNDLIDKSSLLLSVRETKGSPSSEELPTSPPATRLSLQKPPETGMKRFMSAARSVQDMRSVMAHMRSLTWGKGLAVKDATEADVDEPTEETRMPIRRVFSISNLCEGDWEQARSPMYRDAIQSIVLCLLAFRDTLEGLGVSTEGSNDIPKNTAAAVTQQADWLRSPRYVMENDRKLYFEQIGTRLEYGYEFLGAPLPQLSTDATFAAIDAIGHYRGVMFTDSTNDQSLAGTTVADLVGRPCLVFSCGPTLGSASLTRLMRGAVASGALLLLEGVDMASASTISVIGGDIAHIQRSWQHHRVECGVGGVNVPLATGGAIIASLSSNSLSEIPSNFRVLFRPISLACPNISAYLERDLVLRGLVTLSPSDDPTSKTLPSRRSSSITASAARLSTTSMDGGVSTLTQSLAWLLENASLTEQQLHFALDLVEQYMITSLCDDRVKYIEHDRLLPEALRLIWGLPTAKVGRVHWQLLRDAGFKWKSIEHTPMFSSLWDTEDAANALREALNIELGEDKWVDTAVELYRAMETGRPCIFIGPCGSGKTTILRALAAALSRLGPPWRAVNLCSFFPGASGYSLTFGAFCDNGEYHDGLLGNAVRAHINESHQSEDADKRALWLVFDGSVSDKWMDGLVGLVERNHVYSANGETLPLPLHSKLVIETDSLADVSPALLSKYTVIHNSSYCDPWSVGCDDEEGWQEWQPSLKSMIEEWLDGVKTEFPSSCTDRILQLIGTAVPDTVNMLSGSDDVHTPLHSLESVLRTFFDIIRSFMTIDCVDPVFIYAWAWAFGGPLSTAHRQQLDAYLRTVGNRWTLNVTLPDIGTIFDYKVDTEHNLFVPWTDIVNDVENGEYIETEVSAAHGYVIQSLIKADRPVLVTGSQNGKSALAEHFVHRIGKPFSSATFACTCQSSASSLRLFCERYLERRRKGVYAPPLGNKMLVVCDDLSRWPTKQLISSRRGNPIDLLRQLHDQGGWYDDSLAFRDILDVVVLATAVNASFMGARTMRYFAHISMPMAEQWTLQKALEKYLSPFTVTRAYALAEALLLFKSEADKASIRFNLHDLFNVARGLKLGASVDDAKLWVSEMMRVLQDPSAGEKMCMDMACTSLGLDDKAEVPIFAAFGPLLEDIGNLESAQRKVSMRLNESNIERCIGVGSLPRMAHSTKFVASLTRAIAVKGGIAVIGMEGDNRDTLVGLAAALANYVVLTRSHSTPTKFSWRADLRRAMMASGVDGKQIMIVLNEDDLRVICGDEDIWKSQVMRFESQTTMGPTNAPDGDQLTELINVIRTGDCTTLWSSDDRQSMSSALRSTLRAAGIADTVFNTLSEFGRRVKENLCVVLSVDEGKTLSKCIDAYPSLLDVFRPVHHHAATEDELRTYAHDQLANTDLSSDLDKDNIVDACVAIHVAARDTSHTESQYAVRGAGSASADIMSSCVTDMSFIELLALFKSWLDKWRLDHGMKIGAIEQAADCADRLRELIEAAKLELRSVEPSLRAASDHVEDVVKAVAQQRFEEDALNSRVSLQEQALLQMQRDAADTMELISNTTSIAEKELAEAVTLLRSVTRKDVERERSIAQPGPKQLFAMQCVFLLRGLNVRKDLWSEARSLMSSRDFVKALVAVDTTQLTPTIWNQIIEMTTRFLGIRQPNLSAKQEKKERCSTGVSAYVIAIVRHYQAREECQPKYNVLQETQQQILEEQTVLENLQKQLSDLQEQIASESVRHKESVDLRTELAQQANNCEKRIERSNHLLRILKDDLTRWKEKTDVRTKEFLELTGTSLFSAACVSYLGPLSTGAQSSLIDTWDGIIRHHEIKIPSQSPNSLLFPGDVELAECVARGLPRTHAARRMAACLKYSLRWPMILDADGLGTKLLKHVVEDDSHTIVKLDPEDSNCLSRLKDCLAEGSHVVMTIDEGDVDALPSAIHLLLKCGLLQNRSTQERRTIRIGDHTIELNPSFRLLILSSSHGGTLPSSVFAHFNVINMTVNGSDPDKIASLMLESIATKQKDGALHETVAMSTRSHASLELRIEEVEHAVVTTLNTGLGDNSTLSQIMSDNAFVDKISETKKTIGELRTSLRDNDIRGETARESMRPLIDVAKRAAALFSGLWDVPAIVPGVRFSLSWFLSIGTQAVATAMQADTVKRRAELIWGEMIKLVHSAASRVVSEDSMPSFLLLLCARLLQRTPDTQGGACDEDVAFLLGRYPSGAVDDNPYPNWLSDEAWIKLVSLSRLPKFHGILTAIASAPSKWQEFVVKAHAQCGNEALLFPSGWSDGRLTHFQELLLWSCLCPSRIPHLVPAMAKDMIGASIVKPTDTDPTSQLYSALRSSAPLLPILVLCGESSDSLGGIMNLAENQGMEHVVIHISVGSGLGESVMTTIDDAIDRGKWVVIENPHLELGLIPQIRHVVAHIPPMRVNSDFRLWILVPSSIGASLPDPLIRRCVVVSLNSATSLRTEMVHLLTVHRNLVDTIAPDTPYRRVAFALLFCSAVLSQRQLYGKLGFSSASIGGPLLHDWDSGLLLNVLNGLVDAHGGLSERGPERQRTFERFPISTLLSTTQAILGAGLLSAWDRTIVIGVLDNIRWSSLVTIPLVKSGPAVGGSGMGSRRASVNRTSRRRLSITSPGIAAPETPDTVALLRMLENGGTTKAIPIHPAHLGTLGPLASKMPARPAPLHGIEYGVPEITSLKSFQNYVHDQMPSSDPPSILGLPEAAQPMRPCSLGVQCVQSLTNVYHDNHEQWAADGRRYIDAIDELLSIARSLDSVRDAVESDPFEFFNWGVFEGVSAMRLLMALRRDLVHALMMREDDELASAIRHNRISPSWKCIGVRTGGGVWTLKQGMHDVLARCKAALELAQTDSGKLPDKIELSRLLAPRLLSRALMRRASVRRGVHPGQLRAVFIVPGTDAPPQSSDSVTLTNMVLVGAGLDERGRICEGNDVAINLRLSVVGVDEQVGHVGMSHLYMCPIFASSGRADCEADDDFVGLTALATTSSSTLWARRGVAIAPSEKSHRVGEACV